MPVSPHTISSSNQRIFSNTSFLKYMRFTAVRAKSLLLVGSAVKYYLIEQGFGNCMSSKSINKTFSSIQYYGLFFIYAYRYARSRACRIDILGRLNT